MTVTELRIQDAERPYPVAVVEHRERGPLTIHRRYGSWVVDIGGTMWEPLAFDVDPADLQTHPDVKAFDAERRRALAVAEASAEPEPEPEARDWSKGDQVWWTGSKARVIGDSKQGAEYVRIKCQKIVHHVRKTTLQERVAGRRPR